MFGISYALLFALSIASVRARSAVLDLLPHNYDEVVLKSGKPALVEFFAPWCGHCKTLAPTYEELALNYAHASDQLIIAKVDADEHKKLGKRFNVQGFPTLKWFDGKNDQPEEYGGGRDLDSLTKFITDKTGIKPKTKKTPPSEVKMLDDASFKEQVGGEKNIFVAFTAPWCGHCKSLVPIWEDVAHDFANEPNVVIAKVDAEAPNAKATAEEQDIKGFPTIKFFPKGSTTPKAYEGSRTAKDFVSYLNEQAGTHRLVGGLLDTKAGTIDAIDSVIAKIVKGQTLASVTKEVQQAAQDLKDVSVDYYLKVLTKLQQNESYVEKELARVQALLKKDTGLTPAKLDDLTIRRNILVKFNFSSSSPSRQEEEGEPKEEL